MTGKTNVTKAEKVLLGLTAVFLCVLVGLYFHDARETDGERVSVTTQKEVPQETLTPDFTPVNINTATAAELTELPGIGEKLAERIVEYRTVNGPFTSVEEIMEVDGIGEGKFSDLEGRITVN